MSIDTMLNTTIKSVVANVSPNLYTGTATEYCVYSYQEHPTVFADGKPSVMTYTIQVSMYLPHKKNPNVLKKRLANALMNSGCTYPNIINASDGEGQQYVFECVYADGDL